MTGSLKWVEKSSPYSPWALLDVIRLSFLAGAREFSSGSVDITRTFEAGPWKSARYANSNSDLPACITKDPVPKVTPSYQAGHEPRISYQMGTINNKIWQFMKFVVDFQHNVYFNTSLSNTRWEIFPNDKQTFTVHLPCCWLCCMKSLDQCGPTAVDFQYRWSLPVSLMMHEDQQAIYSRLRKAWHTARVCDK